MTDISPRTVMSESIRRDYEKVVAERDRYRQAIVDFIDDYDNGEQVGILILVNALGKGRLSENHK